MPPSEDAISLTGDQGPTKHTNVDSALGKEGFFSPSHRSFLRQNERNLHIERQLVVTLATSSQTPLCPSVCHLKLSHVIHTTFFLLPFSTSSSSIHAASALRPRIPIRQYIAGNTRLFLFGLADVCGGLRQTDQSKYRNTCTGMFITHAAACNVIGR